MQEKLSSLRSKVAGLQAEQGRLEGRGQQIRQTLIKSLEALGLDSSAVDSDQLYQSLSDLRLELKAKQAEFGQQMEQITAQLETEYARFELDRDRLNTAEGS